MLLKHEYNKNINRNVYHHLVTEQVNTAVTYLTCIWGAPASNHCQKPATLLFLHCPYSAKKRAGTVPCNWSHVSQFNMQLGYHISCWPT